MTDDQPRSDDEIIASIADATGVDPTRARFMLGLQRGDVSGDVVVMGGAHFDPPAVELSSIEGGRIVHAATGVGASFLLIETLMGETWPEPELAPATPRR
jgi:hypothetical protein